MKAKALKHKVTGEYGVIDSYNNEEGRMTTCQLPDLFPVTATIEGIKKFCSPDIVLALDDYDLITIEFEEINDIEDGNESNIP